jgi:NAD(P)-dependent dehydrogenase (short-subunit alcohol dehydrogenase family)
MDMGLRDRVAFVTGAATGIGAAIAESLAMEGCIVWIADRDGGEAQRTAFDFTSRNLRARSVAVDVTQPDAATVAIEGVLRQDSRLDILVCNAGVLKSQAFRDSSLGDWKDVVDVNLFGVIHCIRAAVSGMAGRGGGRIVNIASVAAMRGGGSIGNTLYGTTKAGVVALTQGLARELGPLGITVNAVAPAVADTRMTRANLSDDVRERSHRAHTSRAARKAGRCRGCCHLPGVGSCPLRQRDRATGRRRYSHDMNLVGPAPTNGPHLSEKA